MRSKSMLYRWPLSLQLKNRRGAVELIELLFVTALLSSVGIAMYFTLLFSQQTNLRIEHYALASQIASDQIEYLRGTPYANLTTPYNGSFLGNTAISSLPNGTTNLTVSYNDSPTNTIKKAVATVRWKENNKDQSLSYTTLIVDRGVGQ